MRFSIVLFLCVLSSASCRAQKQVDAIVVEGVENHHIGFIEQFISIRAGDDVDTARAIADCHLLRQLPSVYHADVKWEDRNGQWTQVYFLEEARTLIPYVYAGQGGAMESLTLQAGVSEFNFLGRGVWLMADYQYKELHSASVAFRIPFVTGRPWNVGGAFKHWNTIEPLYFGELPVRYHYQNRYGQLNVSRLITPRDEVGVSAALFDETYERRTLAEEEIAPSNQYFQKRLLQVFTRMDHRRPHFFIQRGTLTEIRLTTVFNKTIPDERFEQLEANFRHYRQLRPNWNGALRLQAGISTHREGPFSPFVFDSQLNLRGSGDRVARGTATVVANSEWRRTLIDKSKWAVQAVGFVDAGWLREADDDRMQMKPKAFAGVGARFHVKRFYNAIFRVDYGQGVVRDQSGGFVFGLGQYF